MTEKVAIKILQEEHDYAQLLSYVNEALQMARNALEKQIPKKPKGTCWLRCPSCDKMLDVWVRKNYCGGCGQKIDWSDDE